jgi:broad specificity phosphatase PhoE
MSKLLVIRHGQARLFSDDYDRLSELGVRQAESLGRWFVQRGIVPDEIYCGSLLRQRQTADAVGSVLRAAGKTVTDLQVLEGLNEYPAEEIMRQLVPALRGSDPEIDRLAENYDQADDYDSRYRSLHQLLALTMQRWISGDYDRSDALLSWAGFSGAVRSALADAMRNNGSGKTVAVFTSGGPIGVAVQSVLDAPDLKAAELNWRIYNCSVTRFTFDGERVSLDAFNDTAHMPPEMLSFR